MLDLIHKDVWGPTQNVSLGGSRYFVSFIGDYSRHTWIYLIEKKKPNRRRIFFQPIQKLFAIYGNSGRIQLQIYTPEQNGLAERKNRLIVEAARAMLEEKSMHKFYWAKAV